MSLSEFENAVLPLLTELEASANAADTDRHMAPYMNSPSLTFVFNGEIVRGWNALYELQCQWWIDDSIKRTYKYLGTPIIETMGTDAGLTTFLIAATREEADGTFVERTLAYSALWRRLGERWCITFAHESFGK